MSITRSITVAGALAAVALPGAAFAQSDTTKQDRTNAAKECKALRGEAGTPQREAFEAQFKNLGQCVSRTAKEEAAERKAAKRNASKECKQLRSTDQAAFDAQFRNLGQCVSQKAKENKKAADAEDREERKAVVNAAKACDAERGETQESQTAFQARYGSNANDKNAFGKCVSQTAQADEEAS